MVSRLCGIVDQRGGLRVVITDGSPYTHLTPGDMLYIVPGVTVQEPVPMQDWAKLVKIVEDHIKGA